MILTDILFKSLLEFVSYAIFGTTTVWEVNAAISYEVPSTERQSGLFGVNSVSRIVSPKTSTRGVPGTICSGNSKIPS